MKTRYYRVLAALNMPPLEHAPAPHHVRAVVIDPMVPLPIEARVAEVRLEAGGSMAITLASAPRKGARVHFTYPVGGAFVVENATGHPLEKGTP